MKIITGIITAPGRINPTLDDTVKSLKAAGFKQPLVYTDNNYSGCWVNWITAISDLVSIDADAIMICEDDVCFSTGLREYLEVSLWPEDPNKIALCSAFCPKLYSIKRTGWHIENRGWSLCMAQSWIIPKQTLELIYNQFKNVPEETERIPRVTPKNVKYHTKSIRDRLLTDSRIGQWASHNKLNVWYHTPSLAQHTAIDNSLIGNSFSMPSLRKAKDFNTNSDYKQIMLDVIAGIVD